MVTSRQTGGYSNSLSCLEKGIMRLARSAVVGPGFPCLKAVYFGQFGR